MLPVAARCAGAPVGASPDALSASASARKCVRTSSAARAFSASCRCTRAGCRTAGGGSAGCAAGRCPARAPGRTGSCRRPRLKRIDGGTSRAAGHRFAADDIGCCADRTDLLEGMDLLGRRARPQPRAARLRSLEPSEVELAEAVDLRFADAFVDAKRLYDVRRSLGSVLLTVPVGRCRTGEPADLRSSGRRAGRRSRRSRASDSGCLRKERSS